MKSIYEHQNYKEAVQSWLKAQPKEGRGLLSRMAEEAQLSAAMITQIINGDKHLSPEAAYTIAQFMGLGENETHYFLLLVQWARAGSHGLKESLGQRVKQEQKKARELKTKIKPDTELNEKIKQQFYSDWIFTGVRNMVACPDFQTVEALAQHLKLPRVVVQRVVEFLVSFGLCVVKDGRLHVGPQITHVGHEDPLVQTHHKNWRLQGMSRMTERNDSNVFFTSPMSLSQKDAELIRHRIPSFIEEIRKVVGPSKSEVVRCLNLDWFAY